MIGWRRPRTITFTTAMLGQVIRRDEADNIAYDPVWMKGGDPHEVWYRFNGRQIAFTGNNGTLDVSYAASIASRIKVAGHRHRRRPLPPRPPQRPRRHRSRPQPADAASSFRRLPLDWSISHFQTVAGKLWPKP